AKEDADIIISGHLHIPFIKTVSGKAFICVGDWMENFTYLLIKDDEFILKNSSGEILHILKI
ncbi:MAG: phosphodiesterase, partial [candidate division WOR-3 bacterium]